ncbi:tRNA-splicing endonuclease subunit [Colletotrichum karsti]|uniref:tRNA-intron lyase n=1 Tax=Colletotrichum karsti TaxID=1095194 RepID=A0A9P6I8F3_9PEZI|nr:tRNA-splicing endonuclease subunit [Colletotrichum karsti]KAF9877061.1 tRNA-splicing endonuclease subunit [Colletotrichum karsti]
MSDSKNTAPQPSPAGAMGQQSSQASTQRPRGPPLYKIYELPAPMRTFPLPSFYPNNPISLFHVLFAWTKQTFFPPPAEPSVVHEGIWSPESKSVHIVDEKSMRALWQQGFYGKGNLSRSEPNWLKREQVRRGLVPGQVSELVTANRREERRQMKWERAKSEQEAIRQKRLQEAQEAAVNVAGATINSVNGYEPALAEAMPEPLAQATSNVTTDASINTSTEPVPGVVSSTSIEIPAATANGLVNGVTSPIEVPTAQLGSATIIEPEDVLAAVKQADIIPDAEPLLKANSILPALASLSAPTGPLELLRLPNSNTTPTNVADTTETAAEPDHTPESLTNGVSTPASAPVGPLELLLLPNAHVSLVNGTQVDVINGTADVETTSSTQKLSTIPEDASHGEKATTGHLINDLINGVNGDDAYATDTGTVKTISTVSTDLPSTPKPLKRRKSVRFSPRVESTTYQLSDPPSPSFALLNGKPTPLLNGTSLGPSIVEAEEEEAKQASNGTASIEPVTTAEPTTQPAEIVNKEHLQLTSEEAFFLSFGLGALRVVNPKSKQPISTPDLLNLFRQYSYFPSRASADLQPDDSFLVNYAVYHHFRSLGWVPRAGIKFGVDWLLYAKGPVFDHAEFGAIVLPSYSDRWWKDSDHELPRKTWHWLHGVVRVLSHVQKSLVLVYVDVPPPPQFDAAMKKGGPAEVFKLYKIREVMVKRWSSNRNR